MGLTLQHTTVYAVPPSASCGKDGDEDCPWIREEQDIGAGWTMGGVGRYLTTKPSRNDDLYHTSYIVEQSTAIIAASVVSTPCDRSISSRDFLSGHGRNHHKGHDRDGGRGRKTNNTCPGEGEDLT